jgi:monothiol glutaredoxin
MSTLSEQIKQVIETEPVAVFIKGTPDAPACGNSLRALQALWQSGAPITAVDILPDPRIRQELTALTEWPTIPQVFVKGELIGGADITEELNSSGELRQKLDDALGSTATRSCARSSSRSPRRRRAEAEVSARGGRTLTSGKKSSTWDSGMPSAENIAVLVVEDDSIVRSWVRLCLRDSELRVAGEARSAQEAEELIGRRHCDVLLVDQHSPTGSAPSSCAGCAGRHRAPAVLMTASASRAERDRLGGRRPGERRQVVGPRAADRGDPPALAGEGVFDAAHPRRPEGQASLAPLEQQALAHVAEGKTNRETAAQLGISDETVKTLLERAYTKLGVRRRAEAVLEARRRGLV